MKTCSKCKERKLSKYFSKNVNTKDGLSFWCKKCKREYYLRNHGRMLKYGHNYNSTHKRERLEYKKQYDFKNKERIKKYYSENKDKIKKYGKSWRIKNKGKINEYHKNRRHADIKYKITCSLRTRLNMAIKKNFKVGSAVRDLGCSIGEFKSYIGSKFQDGMTWNNYGRSGWHIDHIIPLSSFNLGNRDEFLKACHYTNLQPLWARDNLSKGRKYN